YYLNTKTMILRDGSSITSPGSRTPRYTTSDRGGVVLEYRGFKFYKQRTNGHKTRWFCSFAQKYRCRAAVYTCNESLDVIKIIKQHNHHMTNTETVLQLLQKPFVTMTD
ncbi:hypothetical protein ACJJTC_009958, partial [Scirpophaga incertulas]